MSIAIYSASQISHHWPFLNYSKNLSCPYDPSYCAALQMSCRVSELSALSWKAHVSTWCASYLKQCWRRDWGKCRPRWYLGKAAWTLSEHRARYHQCSAVLDSHSGDSPTSSRTLSSSPLTFVVLLLLSIKSGTLQVMVMVKLNLSAWYDIASYLVLFLLNVAKFLSYFIEHIWPAHQQKI